MSLRSQIVRGGVYLAFREGLGMAVSVCGMLLLTRAIGPANFGIYVAAAGFLTYFQNLSQWGIGVYLIRRSGDEDRKVYDQAFSLIVVLSILGLAVAVALVPFLESWTRLPGLSSVAFVLFPGLLPLQLTTIPLAQLERQLKYRQVAVTELSGQIAFYVVALPIAFATSRGVWAPVAGWWAQQLVLTGCYFLIQRYRPRWDWSWSAAREMTSYGLGFSASLWIWQLRALVNPLIVGRFVGAAGVGTIALAIRVVEALCFVKSATWRISIAALGQMQRDIPRLTRAISEGMTLQVLALGPLLLLFLLIGPVFLPLTFGPKWLPALAVFPLIATGYLVNAVFSLHSSGLYVLQRNWHVAAFHVIHITLFAGATYLLVPHFGIMGYGWAEIAALPSYFLLDRSTAIHVGRPSYAHVGVWLIVLATPLLAYAAVDPPLSYAPLILLPLPLLWSSTRREIGTLINAIRVGRN